MAKIEKVTNVAKRGFRAYRVEREGFKPSFDFNFDEVKKCFIFEAKFEDNFKKEYEEFDAEKKFPVEPPPPKEPKGCKCGEILKGKALPPDCPLFGKACTQEHPVGPCMVSSEGPCAAYYIYFSQSPASRS